MTISRVNASGWGVGNKLTSSQANGLDLNGTYSLDKRSGQTDTLASVVSASGSGRVIPTHATGADADTTYYASGANAVLQIPASITAARAYTFSNTNAAAGDRIHIYSAAALQRTITIKNSGGTVLCKLGSSPYLDDSFDARGCVLRHNGTDWFVESLNYERYEILSQLVLQSSSRLAKLAAGTITPNWGPICFDSKARRFYYGGGTDIVGYTESGGETVSDDVIPGGQKATKTICDLAASDTGIVVATTYNIDVYTQPSGSTFSHYTPFAASTACAAICYDTGNNKFVCANVQVSTGYLLYSSNGSAWAGSTAPANPPADYLGGCAIGADGNGRVVAAYYDNALGKLHFSYTDNAGTSWSAGSTVTGIVTGLSPDQWSRKIEYDPIRGEWSMVMGVVGSASYALTSSDGATWSLAFTSGSATDPGLFSVVAVGGLWLILAGTNDVLVSRDNFTSIQYVGTKLGVAASYARPAIATGGSLLMGFAEAKLVSAPVPGRNMSNLF